MITTIGEITEFQKGFAFKSKDYQETGIRIVRVTNLNRGDYTDENSLFIDTEKASEYERYDLKKNDVVISTVGSWPTNPASVVGKVSIIPAEVDGSLLNQNAVRLRAKDICSQEYLGYLLRDIKFQNYIVGTAQGSASQASITLEDIRRYQVDLPEKEIQEKRIGLLKCIDEKIRVNEATNRNLEEQIVTIYRSWFLSFEHFTDTLEDGELGRQPIGWKVVPLKEVTENIRDRVKGNVDSVKVLSAINTGKLILSEEYFTKQVFSKDISKYILVEENDFAYNPARVNIGSIGINDLGIRGCVSPVYVVVRTEKGYENFLRYFLCTDRFKTEVITRASGSVRQAMNYTDFGLIKVIYPPKDVVKEFNDMISPLQIAIKHNEIQNANLAELRDSLLPKLMSGELDVSELDI